MWIVGFIGAAVMAVWKDDRERSMIMDEGSEFHILIKSNQVKSNLFKVGNVHLKEKKISKKLFTQLYSITNNNKLYS